MEMAELKCNEGSIDQNITNTSKEPAPSKVLYVHSLPYGTTKEELIRLVSNYGQVIKTFLLQEKCQGFIEMESLAASRTALNYLGGYPPPELRSRQIFFAYSNRSEITDSTSNHTSGEGNGKSSVSSVLLMTIFSGNFPVSLENICGLCKPYGEVLKIILFSKKGGGRQSLVQMANEDAAIKVKQGLEGKEHFFGGIGQLRIDFSKRKSLVIRQNDAKSRDFTTALTRPFPNQINNTHPIRTNGYQRFLNGGSLLNTNIFGATSYCEGPPVVLVNKLNEEKIDVDKLFTLFGLFGDVIRVKILYNKRDTALVQFKNSHEAMLAQMYLNGCPLYGQKIVISHSRMNEVQMPKQQNQDGQELTKDFTHSPNHRFKYKYYPNPKNINTPSQVLYVANIHETVKEPDLRDLFGAQQTADDEPVVEFFKMSRRMAYIAMASVEDAVHALINLHNHKLGGEGGYPLRISFSHKDARSLVNSDQQHQQTGL